MKITMDGKYQTRDGRAVRILATDVRRQKACVIGLVEKDGTESPSYWGADGKDLVFRSDGRDDLVLIPTEHEAWSIMPHGGVVSSVRFATLAEAMKDCQKGESVVKLTWRDD